MDERLIFQTVCRHQGALDFRELSDACPGVSDAVDTLLSNKNSFCVVLLNGDKRIIAKTSLRLCRNPECGGCKNLHLCKFYLLGDCKNNRGKRRCRFGHDLNSEQNAYAMRVHKLESLTKLEIRNLLLQNDGSILPPVCSSYNRGSGEYGECLEQQLCRRLHVCDRYIRGVCLATDPCSRSHDFFEPHPVMTLQERRVPAELMGSLLSVYRNIQQMKGDGIGGGRPSRAQTAGQASAAANTEICLSFFRGDCKNKDKCWRVHFKMPYRWEVREGSRWSALPDNEAIERDYCDPAKVLWQGTEQVRFDTMTCELKPVRRLSTASSVVQPTFVLTTQWLWYWEDENGKWIQYASIKEMHRLSSIDSEELEKKYQEDKSAQVNFTAGKQSYELSFKDMVQKNELYGTARSVRRRPAFVSAVNAQSARSRRNAPLNHTLNFKAVPRSWDKSVIPDIGYKAVPLKSSDQDYLYVQELFNKTMTGFTILSIERVQNKELWDIFQWKRDIMRKSNEGRKFKEPLLFHGTESRHTEAICRENFDWRLCGTNGTVYGEGSYFARDAEYSHSFTSPSEVRCMFACRILVGHYTRGKSTYRRPPPKDEANPSVFYDSCVNDVRDPSIYVVFEKHQVYPEYLIRYDEATFDQNQDPPTTFSKPTPLPSTLNLLSTVTTIPVAKTTSHLYPQDSQPPVPAPAPAGTPESSDAPGGDTPARGDPGVLSSTSTLSGLPSKSGCPVTSPGMVVISSTTNSAPDLSTKALSHPLSSTLPPETRPSHSTYYSKASSPHSMYSSTTSSPRPLFSPTTSSPRPYSSTTSSPHPYSSTTSSPRPYSPTTSSPCPLFSPTTSSPRPYSPTTSSPPSQYGVRATHAFSSSPAPRPFSSSSHPQVLSESTRRSTDSLYTVPTISKLQKAPVNEKNDCVLL